MSAMNQEVRDLWDDLGKDGYALIVVSRFRGKMTKWNDGDDPGDCPDGWRIIPSMFSGLFTA